MVGCVWSTAKHKDLEGQRLLVVERLTPEMKATGVTTVCTDATGAGAGEVVYYCRSRESSFAFHPKDVPTDATIVAIVDSIHVERS